MFDDKIFKKYDIRGRYEIQFDLEFVKNLGKAFCTHLINNKTDDDNRTVTIGYDARLSSEPIRDALIAGIMESGFDAADIGLCPTPLLYFSLHKDNFAGGIMITGSHNPPDYNGFKVSMGNDSIYGDAIINLRDIIKNAGYKSLDSREPASKTIDFNQAYLAEMKESFVPTGKKLKVAVDAGNGSGGRLLVDALKGYGVEVHELFIEPDGTFPNHHPDPAKLDNMNDLIKAVKDNGLDLGFALDGDGDRLGVVDSSGNIVQPDIYMILFCKDIIRRKDNAVFISEVKCSQVLYDEVRAAGGEIIMFKTGHSLIKNEMKKRNAEFAGEMSGHLFFKDGYYGYDDAIYSALRLIKIIMESDQNINEMTEQYMIYESTPELRIEVDDAKKFELMEKLTKNFFELKGSGSSINEIITIDGARVLFEDGWGLVRPSNTEPHFVLRFEAKSKESLTRIKDYVFNEVNSILD